MLNYTMPKQIGNHNKYQILTLLRERGPASRAALSRLLGISPVAVSRNTAQLLHKGIIRECKAENSEMGRKPVPVELCADFCYVLGADMVGGTIKAALANLMGEIINYREEPVLVDRGAQAAMEQLISVLNATINTAGINREKVRILTVGTPGIFNAETGKSSFSFFLDTWDDINIRDNISLNLRIKTIIENDVNLDIIGENWKGVGKDHDNIFYLKLGQGLAARFVFQKNLLRGEHNMAGEIGLMLPHLPGGNTHNYEQMLCNAAVSQKYRECGGKNRVQTISDVSVLSAQGDETAETVMLFLLDQLAVVMLNSITVADPQVIILGGDACSFTENHIRLLKNRIEKYFPPVQNIIPSALGGKAGVYGAIKAGLDYIEELITDV
ncbi:MAG: ROK family transcriptional regulator [Treponema sp.]|nr:ROK family transcriptional regulator [Treponema sp.]